MEQNDLLPKSNQSLIQKRLKNFKKSLIRTMAGLGTAAILLTGTGCDQTIKPDTTNPIIDKETDYTYQDTEPTVTTPTETEPTVTDKVGETEPVETNPVEQDGYVSDVANKIINNTKYEEYKAELETVNSTDMPFISSTNYSCYGTSFNPTNYDYFKTIYPNASEDEICYGTRVYTDFTIDNDLYVCFASMPRLNNIDDGNYVLKSLFRYDNISEDILNDLAFSKDNALDHTLILKSVIDNNSGILLAESVLNTNRAKLENLGIKNDARSFISFNGIKEDKSLKYCYIITESNGEKTLHHIEFPYGSESDISSEAYKDAYGFDGIRIDSNDQYTFLEELGKIDYIVTSSTNIDKMKQKEITLN